VTISTDTDIVLFVFLGDLTMTDLNTAIAKYLGWKCYEQPRSGYRLQYVYAPGKFPWDTTRDKEELKARCTEIDLTQIDPGKFDGQKMPDYLNDARLYMALADEMKTIGMFVLQYIVTEKVWLCTVRSFTNDIDIEEESDTVGTAICQAYCKLKGIKL